jgi:hypothetical protein
VGACPTSSATPAAPQVNYRTHSGVLECASAVVDALRRFFPQHIDALERERAFFKVCARLEKMTVAAAKRLLWASPF